MDAKAGIEVPLHNFHGISYDSDVRSTVLPAHTHTHTHTHRQIKRKYLYPITPPYPTLPPSVS